MTAASPARDCEPSCPRSYADEEGSSWPSGAPVLKSGDVTIPILSGRTLQLTILDTPPAQRVRSIRSDRAGPGGRAFLFPIVSGAAPETLRYKIALPERHFGQAAG